MEDVEQLLVDNTKPTAGETMFFVGAAVPVTLIPLYVFLNIKGLALEGNVVVLAVVTLFAALVLAYAYGNAALNKRAGLERAKKAAKNKRSGAASGTRKEAKEQRARQEEQERVATSMEATAYAIASVNLVFLLLFVFLSSLLSFPVVYNYILAVILSAVGMAFLTQSKN